MGKYHKGTIIKMKQDYHIKIYISTEEIQDDPVRNRARCGTVLCTLRLSIYGRYDALPPVQVPPISESNLVPNPLANGNLRERSVIANCNHRDRELQSVIAELELGWVPFAELELDGFRSRNWNSDGFRSRNWNSRCVPFAERGTGTGTRDGFRSRNAELELELAMGSVRMGLSVPALASPIGLVWFLGGTSSEL
ncbi:hypothetical protein ZOSMA_36G00740 [Zostera marina]|uniref:Uncharacterized protein n=1 Tax=Zostera marina TaxID=29655 RepID=A0A0K9P603_ZOSMR|nr:hypothetical protein ZOSMA_36G00740 [Zostera marina]